MPRIKVKDNESFDAALRRFRRSCEKSGVLAEARKREFYEKPTTIRKRKAIAAKKRSRKQQILSNQPIGRTFNFGQRKNKRRY